MVNGIKASGFRGLNKCCEYNNEYEDNSPKTLHDKNPQASSQKFRQLTYQRTKETVGHEI